MAELSDLARELCPGVGEPDYSLAVPLRDFIEVLTFADVDAIRRMLDEFVVGVGPLPVWARNLAYRLACLQRPGDAALLREASVDLWMHGPDWDGIAADLGERASAIDGGPATAVASDGGTSQPPGHQPDSGPGDEGFGDFREAFVVPGVPPGLGGPGSVREDAVCGTMSGCPRITRPWSPSA